MSSIAPDRPHTADAKPVSSEPAKPQRPFAYLGCGIAMGTCNVIPGGDSGTIALIVGIYSRIVTAISHIDATLLALLMKRQWRAIYDRLDLGFMVPLVAGVGIGIASMGKLMHYLLEHQFNIMMPIFFGLIAASCWMVAKLVERWGTTEIVCIISGIVIAFGLMLLPSLSHPPESLWYIVLCGVIGICALILPGISGAFLLLFMGKYHDLTGVIDRATKLDLSQHDFAVLAAFGVGCFLGLVGCSKFLKWLMEKHAAPTMAALCGFKIGSLYKIWPFQRDMTPEIEVFKKKDFQPIPLSEMQIDQTFWVGIALVLVAGGLTLILDRIAFRKEKELKEEGII